MADRTGVVVAPWLSAPESRRVLDVLEAGGGAARFVGGCVRDALLVAGTDATDLDLATQELPERVMALLGAAGIRHLPTGLRHGTVTALVQARRFEITTLRRDVACFGRHAEVEFTRDFDEDARRRDFTINALSCDRAGRLFDPVGGRADLLAGRVRFVGAARDRIAEDYLRILRFFRFQARFGRGDADPTALAACAELAPGLDRLSGERVRQELWGILASARVLAALQPMQATGVLARVLPGPVAPGQLARLLAVWPDADPLLRLAALLRDGWADSGAIESLAARLRLARVEAERLSRLLLTPLPEVGAPDRAQRRAIHALGPALYADLVRLAVATARADPQVALGPLALAATWPVPVLPVTGADLLARGIPPGPRLGRLLAAVREHWAEQDFRPDRAACLAVLDRLLARASPMVDTPPARD